jgi:hypothetical protein
MASNGLLIPRTCECDSVKVLEVERLPVLEDPGRALMGISHTPVRGRFDTHSEDGAERVEDTASRVGVMWPQANEHLVLPRSWQRQAIDSPQSFRRGRDLAHTSISD